MAASNPRKDAPENSNLKAARPHAEQGQPEEEDPNEDDEVQMSPTGWPARG